MKSKIIKAIRMALGGVFVFASIDKIAHPAAFAHAVYNYQILPDPLINLTAILLPWTELMIGGFLIFGIWTTGALALFNLLMTVFLSALAFNLARGLNISCGCFSTTVETATTAEMVWTVVRDSLFLIAGVFLMTKQWKERTHLRNNNKENEEKDECMSKNFGNNGFGSRHGDVQPAVGGGAEDADR